MAIDNKAVFLLTGAEPGRKKAFGTGFAVAYEDGQLYLLTCAHVLDQLDNRVRVSGHEVEAEVLTKGGADSIDLALLRIPCQDPPSLLNRTAKGQAEKKFHICGYGPFSGAKNNYVLRDIEGRLGKSIAFESPSTGRVEAWDLHVEDDDFSRLQGGYSGSPLCDEQGRLLAVVSHKIGNEGQRGHAVAIVNVQSLYPEIEQLIPGFLDLSDDSSDVGPRIEQAMMQLSLRVMEIFSIMPRVGQEFERMKREGIAPEDENIFETINAFIQKKSDS
ncbi:trypsin-like peptidase domain-containing protein [Desulfobulbus sp. TB]|nr:trypsin-like peptidase domain-containing protein [Desulfobulbus sp. TB]